MTSLGLASRFLRRSATAAIPATGRLFSSSAAHHETPQIELEFLSPTPGSDEAIPGGESEGGERLRNIMLDNNFDIYAFFAKVELWRSWTLWNLYGRGANQL